MIFKIESACGCNKGKIRKNNEDNFYFDGKCLEVENEGFKILYMLMCQQKEDSVMLFLMAWVEKTSARLHLLPRLARCSGQKELWEII